MGKNAQYWTSEHFFKRLDLLLEQREITFNQLSHLAVTTLSAIYQTRKRGAFPNFQTLCSICDVLEISLWEFFNDEEDFSPEMVTVISEMRTMPHDAQQALAQMVKHIK